MLNGGICATLRCRAANEPYRLLMPCRGVPWEYCGALSTTVGVLRESTAGVPRSGVLRQMGNFPYASNYLVFQQTGDPAVKLPPWPVRAACAHLTGEYPASTP